MTGSYAFHTHWHLYDHLARSSEPERVTCIVCNTEADIAELRVLVSHCQFGGGELVRHECKTCGAIFGPQKFLNLSKTQVNLEYQELYSFYRESSSSAAELRTFDYLQPTNNKVYLNWGCGAWSDSIVQLRNAGYDVWGYEPSAPLDSTVVTRDVSGIEERFDGLFSNNVLEHLLDPVGELRTMHRLLKPGALMAHSTPCYDYVGEDTLFHTLFLTGQSLQRLCKQTGFELIERFEEGGYKVRLFRRL